jgi:hypothetical protein
MKTLLLTLLTPALGAALVLTTNVARAQAVTGPSVTAIVGSATRLEPNGSSADALAGNPHASGIPINEIDLEDCDANLVYVFDLATSSLSSGYNLDAWAGTADCSVLANRQAAAAACWPVEPGIQTNANPFSMRLRMQDIVSQAFATAHAVTYSPATGDVCSLQGAAPATDVKLYFFFVDDEGNAVGTPQSYPVAIDLVANPIAIDAGPVSEQPGGASESGGCAIGPRGSSPTDALGFGLFAAATMIARRRRMIRAHGRSEYNNAS